MSFDKASPLSSKSAKVIRIFESGAKWNPYQTAVQYPGNEKWVEGSDEFYQWGQTEVILFRDILGKEFDAANSILEYGCGPGRILFNMASLGKSVYGVDVSAEMISACKNKVPKAELMLVDQWFSNPPDVDITYSWVTFQHIPMVDGLKIIDHIMQHTKIAALHLVVKDIRPLYIRLLYRLSLLPFLGQVSNLLRGRSWNSPRIPMFVYPEKKLLHHWVDHKGYSVKAGARRDSHEFNSTIYVLTRK
jgi:SAM-dependent methyltransferase